MTLCLNVGDTKGSDRNSGKLEKEHTSSKGAATIQLELFVARCVYGAVLPYFLREARKTEFYMKSFGFKKMAKNKVKF